MTTATLIQQSCYELRFPPLQPHRCGLRFPCNASGEVPLNSLSDRVRNNYFLARFGIGRDFSRPKVEALAQAPIQPASLHLDLPREAYLGTRRSPTALA